MRFCPYLEPPYTDNPTSNKSNIKMWLWGEQRRTDKLRKRSKELLRRAGIDEDWQDKIG